MNYHIIDLSKDYVVKVVKLFIDSIRIHFKNILCDEELYMWTYEGTEKEFYENLETNNLYIRVITNDDGDVLGFTRFGDDYETPGIGWIDLIFVDDAYHNKGFGKYLLHDAFAKLSQDGFDQVHLWTPTFGKAHGFYLKMNGKKANKKINKIGFDLTEYVWELN